MTDSTQNFTVMSKAKVELLVLWKDVNINGCNYLSIGCFFLYRILN